jgi:hypothetical protein
MSLSKEEINKLRCVVALAVSRLTIVSWCRSSAYTCTCAKLDSRITQQQKQNTETINAPPDLRIKLYNIKLNKNN